MSVPGNCSTPKPPRNQARRGWFLCNPACCTPLSTAAKISGRLFLFQGAMAARPAELTTASQSCSRIVRLIKDESVAFPSTAVIWLYMLVGRRDSSLLAERTYATTTWPWVRSAATSRRPRFPVAPMRRTFMFDASCSVSSAQGMYSRY